MQFESLPPKPRTRHIFRLPLYPTEYIVVFIESRPFARRLMQLAGDSADEVLREIQDDCSKILSVGASSKV